ncbi:MAG TPA: DUF3445 domain-containing protein [Acidimicrobiales bacterium]|nr:DUF3445 domain-containing protein [Acidimicrobiales bacterium]
MDDIDLSVSKVHVRMGTHALDEDQWLHPDHLAETEIALRRRLLREQRQDVFACSPVAEAAAEEASDLVTQWCEERGLAIPPSEESHPLARAGSMVQEDLCLMVHHDGAWRLEGAVLCFPSLWILSEKLGLPPAQVHAPVSYFDTEIGTRVDTFFDRLHPAKPVWRRNFSLWPALLLWAPVHSFEPHHYQDTVARSTVPDLWIRSERQTLRRLAATGAILFTIKVQMAPISVLVARPDRGRALAEWFDGPTGETRRAQFGPAHRGLQAWLRGIG